MRYIYIILGLVCTGLGILGVYMPILPHTPFFILATLAFGKGSPKLEAWLKSTNVYKNNVEPIVEKTGMTKERKAKILTFVSVFFAISFFMMKNKVGRLVLALVWIFHFYYFIFRIDGKDKDQTND